MRVTVLILLALLASPAEAACRLGIGAANADSFYALSAESVGTVEAQCTFHVEQWQAAAGYIGEQGRDEYANVEPFGYALVARQFRLYRGTTSGPFASVGLMARTRSDYIEDILPSWWNFALSAGFDAGKWRVEYRHYSNAGLEQPNRGQNLLIISRAIGPGKGTP